MAKIYRYRYLKYCCALALCIFFFLLFSWRLMIWTPGENQTDFVKTHPELTDVIQTLKKDVSWLSQRVVPRSSIAPHHLNLTLDYFETRLRDIGFSDPQRQSYTIDNHQYQNIWVQHPEQSPHAEVIVVGAHYDAFHDTPGANDNASGVAALLYLAEKVRKENLSESFIFVAFANEEPPFFETSGQGAVQFSQWLSNKGISVKAMISLETMGYYSDEPGSQKYPSLLGYLYPSKGNFLGFVGNVASRELVHTAIKTFRDLQLMPAEGASLPSFVPGVGWSDHAAFWEHDIPALMVTDTAPFRYPFYHTN